jgi:vancomycin resistance protein YoaR
MDPSGAPQEAPAPKRRARARRSGWRRALAAFLVTLTAAQLLGLAGLYGFAAAYEGRVLPNVSVAGISLAGLDRAAAETALRRQLPRLSSGTLTLQLGKTKPVVARREVLREYDTVRVDPNTRVISFADLGRDYDMTWMLNQAFAVGHSGSQPGRSMDGLRSLMNPTDVETRATFDPDLVARKLADVAAALRVEPKDARLALSKDSSRFYLARSVEGREIDLADATAQVLRAIGSTSPANVAVELRAVPIVPATTTAAAQAVLAQAQALASRIGASDLRLVGAGRQFRIPAATIRRWVRFAKQPDGSYSAGVSRSLLEAEINKIGRQLYIAPRNAQLFFHGSAAIGYIDSANGRRMETQPVVRAALTALESRATGGGTLSLRLPIATLVPAITSEEAARAAPHMVLLGTWTTRYVPSQRNYYGANIRIPAATINGDVIAPGEWFDFWKALGEVSRATGYGDGGVIRNGRTFPTGALAGGICSASTTLFNAAARAGLDLGQRSNHYYYINRYPLGLDATVLKGSSGPIQNMTFRNDTGHPILIRGINTFGHVRFDIYGIPTGRTVTFSAPRVANVVRAYDTVQYTSSLPTGRRERIEVPSNGMDVWVSRTVREASGALLHQETFYSHYGRVDGILLIGR